MTVVSQNQVEKTPIALGRTRYLAHSDTLMVVVIDFEDGPTAEPDPPHHHSHEQITYVAAGRVRFFLGEEPHDLEVGDMIVVPPDLPHTIQLLTETVRLVDTFHPIRDEFIA